MNVVQVGLDSMYWPVVWAEGLRASATSAPTADRRKPPGLVACCDLGVAAEQVRAEIGMTPAEFAAKYGVPLCSTLVELVRKGHIDAALVSTRNTRMVEVAAALVDKGIPCYLAKPLAASPADAWLLADKAAKANVPCTSGITTRCLPHYQAVHKVIRDRRIGPVVSIDVMHQHGSYAPWPPKTWYREPAEGGVPYWLGWYPLETVRWVAGSPIAVVMAAGRNVTGTVPGESEVITAAGTTQSGVCWSCRIYFAAGSGWRFPMHEVEVVGEQGIVRTLTETRIQVFGETGAAEEAVVAPAGDPVQGELRAWLRSLGGRSVWQPTLKDLAHTVTACEALRRSLQTGRPAYV